MKRLGKIRRIVCTLGVAMMITSCTDNYKEWNTNPTEVPEDMLVGLMKIGNFFPAMQMDVILFSDSRRFLHQFDGLLPTGKFLVHISKI